MMPLRSEHLEIIRDKAHGRVLEYGWYPGVSSSAMAENPNVLSILSWEEKINFVPKYTHPKITVVSGPQPLTGSYDFVFLDHMPIQNEDGRGQAARYWRAKGAEVWVDDADLEPSLAKDAERILNMWRML